MRSLLQHNQITSLPNGLLDNVPLLGYVYVTARVCDARHGRTRRWVEVDCGEA